MRVGRDRDGGNPDPEFFDRIYSVDEDTEKAIEALVYAEALIFFRAFSSKGSAGLVRKAMGDTNRR